VRCLSAAVSPGEHTIGIINVTRRSVLTAIAAALAFVCVFVVGYYATRASLPDAWQEGYYVDATVVRYYFGSVVVMGAVPVVLGLYRLGLIYVAGASAGWIVNCVMIATLDPPRPTMEPAVYNFFIVCAGALAAVVVEVAYRARNRRNQSVGTSAPSSS